MENRLQGASMEAKRSLVGFLQAQDRCEGGLMTVEEN